MVSVFCGQLVGTAIGNNLYARGGWIASGSASVGFVGAALWVCFLRGPWEPGWVGWHGGWNIRRRDLVARKGATQETAVEQPLGELSAGGRQVDVGGKRLPKVEPARIDTHKPEG